MRQRAGRWRSCRRALGLSVAAALLNACSSTDDFLGGKPEPPANSSSFADRFKTLFGGSSSTTATVATTGSPATASPQEVDCPRVDIRQGAATLIMSAPNAEQASLGLRYQATFGRTARQCAVQGPTLSIKVGVQGRVILGPAGGPGETILPLRYALVREGIEPKTIWSKLHMIPVTIPPGQGNVPFTHVEEDMTTPMPSLAELDNYVVYVGFDPEGAALEKKQERKRPAPKPKARRDE